jgi:hypothetical protein
MASLRALNCKFGEGDRIHRELTSRWRETSAMYWRQVKIRQQAYLRRQADGVEEEVQLNVVRVNQTPKNPSGWTMLWQLSCELNL